VRFEGRCTINFGTGSAAACSGEPPKALASRDILEFPNGTRAEIVDYCDDTETVNGKPSSYGKGTWRDKPVIRVLARDGELFEYYPVDEMSPGARAPQ